MFFLKKIVFLKLFFKFFDFKIDNITPDPDPNWMYLDPQHWLLLLSNYTHFVRRCCSSPDCWRICLKSLVRSSPRPPPPTSLSRGWTRASWPSSYSTSTRSYYFDWPNNAQILLYLFYCYSILIKAVDPDPHGSAFIFLPGSGARREKFEEKKIQGNW